MLLSLFFRLEYAMKDLCAARSSELEAARSSVICAARGSDDRARGLERALRGRELVGAFFCIEFEALRVLLEALLVCWNAQVLYGAGRRKCLVTGSVT